MAYVSWRSKHLAGGTSSPFERATARQVQLKRLVAQLMRQPGMDQSQLGRLLIRAKRIRLVVEAEAVMTPRVNDPRKTAKANLGRVSKPDLPGSPRGGRLVANLRILG